MLDKSDTETVRNWLVAALEHAKLKGIQPADLARHCNVTPQAVNGWKTTGRIRKSHLERATAFFGHGPRFSSSAVLARQSIGPEWPFRAISSARYLSLPESERQKIESHAMFIVTEWEKGAHESARSAAATKSKR